MFLISGRAAGVSDVASRYAVLRAAYQVRVSYSGVRVSSIRPTARHATVTDDEHAQRLYSQWFPLCYIHYTAELRSHFQDSLVPDLDIFPKAQ